MASASGVVQDEKGIWHCTSCTKKFTQHNNAVRHFKVHEDATFTCSECNKKIWRTDKIRDHICKTKYPCEYCDEEFTTRREFNQHIKAHIRQQRKQKLDAIEQRFRRISRANKRKKREFSSKDLPEVFKTECCTAPVVPENAPEELQNEIQAKWSWIRTKTDRHRIFQHYNLRVGRLKSVDEALRDIFKLQNNVPYKMTIEGGFMLEKRMQEKDECGKEYMKLQYQ